MNSMLPHLNIRPGRAVVPGILDRRIQREAVIFNSFDEGVEKLTEWVHRDYCPPSPYERFMAGVRKASAAIAKFAATFKRPG